MNETITWPLYKKYGHAFEAFKLIGQDPNSVLGELTKTVTRVRSLRVPARHDRHAFLVRHLCPTAMWLLTLSGSPLSHLAQKNESGEEVAEEVPAVSPEMRESFIVNIRRRMTPTPLKVRADVELTCFAYDGVLHIKEAMRAGESASRPDVVVKMKLVAPPLYVLTTQTLDKDVGVAVLNEAVEKVKVSIEVRWPATRRLRCD